MDFQRTDRYTARLAGVLAARHLARHAIPGTTPLLDPLVCHIQSISLPLTHTHTHTNTHTHTHTHTRARARTIYLFLHFSLCFFQRIYDQNGAPSVSDAGKRVSVRAGGSLMLTRR